jgi:hypothetical protein
MWMTISWVALLIFVGSIIALPLSVAKGKRKKIGGLAAISLVVFLVAVVKWNDDRARNLGFVDADDERAAKDAGVSDPIAWKAARDAVIAKAIATAARAKEDELAAAAKAKQDELAAKTSAAAALNGKPLSDSPAATIAVPSPPPQPKRKLVLRSFMDSPHEIHINDVSYELLAKFPASYSDSLIIGRGKVIQAIDDGDDVVMRVNVTADESYRIFTDTVYVEYHRGFPSGPRIIEDDIVEFAGEFLGIKTYRSVMGATIQIPFVKSDSARVVGTTRKNN